KLRRATPAPLRRTSAPAAAPQAVVSSVERAISYPTGTVGVVGTVGTVGAVGTSGQVLRRPAAMRTMRSSRAVGIWARAILGVCLGIALMQSPYARACGPRLFFDLAARVTGQLLWYQTVPSFTWLPFFRIRSLHFGHVPMRGLSPSRVIRRRIIQDR